MAFFVCLFHLLGLENGDKHWDKTLALSLRLFTSCVERLSAEQQRKKNFRKVRALEKSLHVRHSSFPGYKRRAKMEQVSHYCSARSHFRAASSVLETLSLKSHWVNPFKSVTCQSEESFFWPETPRLRKFLLKLPFTSCLLYSNEFTHISCTHTNAARMRTRTRFTHMKMSITQPKTNTHEHNTHAQNPKLASVPRKAHNFKNNNRSEDLGKSNQHTFTYTDRGI